MSFFPNNQPVPSSLETDHFFLEPLAPKHVALDYEALMASKEMLRIWGGHDWPRDDFTLEDNMADMRFHLREHQQRVAFTYTILNHKRNRSLGCIYIRELAELRIYAPNNTQLQTIPDSSAHLRFWVATPFLEQNLDLLLLADLQTWFRHEWPFQRVLIGTRLAFREQIDLLNNANLPFAFQMIYPGRGGTHHFFDLIAV